MIRRPPISTLSPSPPLSRSRQLPEQRAEPGAADDTRPVLHLPVRRPAQGLLGAVQEPAERVAEPRGTTAGVVERDALGHQRDRKSTRLNSSHANISYAVFCL